ncbi:MULTISPECIES: hypothetical protein [unclassified Streptomyces]|uniref:hypothetical protein n=1 Tax=unclassified Streptomyces TaxID=2593676 RepID=UPI002E2C0875|nr:hypothetical protein [Streptomyces sp. NBC_01601]
MPNSASPKPVAVVTAGDTVARDPAHLGLQRELLELSSRHRHHVVDEASHESVVMHESHSSAVIDALRWTAAASLGTSRKEHG